ncbi:MAG: cell division protein FtsZ [Rhodoplanes sp.]
MSINEKSPDLRELKPRITVFGVGGAGGNAVNNMIRAGLQGVDFVVANTDAQALTMSEAERIIQMGVQVTEGLGAGSHPDVGRAAAEEVLDEICAHLAGAHMVFITAGMGGGTGSGASPVIARAAREMGILTVGVVTKPFHFEGQRRIRIAEQGLAELQAVVDTLIIIPNQNLFRIANEKTTFADAFAMADQVLYSGVGCITDLMVKEGLINLDFADVRSVMREMGKAMMGTGEASGENRALQAAEAAITNPLIYDVSMKGARGLLISISGGSDLTLFEVDEAATRIREEVDPDANIILGAAFDESLDGAIRVSVVATGVDQNVAMTHPGGPAPIETLGRAAEDPSAYETRIAEFAPRLSSEKRRIAHRVECINPSPAALAPEKEQEDFNRAVSQASIEAMATAAVAGALFSGEIPNVNMTPIPPKANLFAQSMRAEDESSELHPPAGSIPAQAKPAGRPRRMPRVDELPIPAQNKIRAHGERFDSEPVKRRMTLLQQLAAAGLGGEDPEAEAKPSLIDAIAPGIPCTEPPMSKPDSESGRLLGPQGLETQALAEEADNDPLDIPNFLRRQPD